MFIGEVYEKEDKVRYSCHVEDNKPTIAVVPTVVLAKEMPDTVTVFSSETYRSLLNS